MQMLQSTNEDHYLPAIDGISTFHTSSPMAITPSPDWSLPCIYSSKTTQKLPSKSLSTSLPFLSLLCLNSRALTVKSSGCSSPVLEEDQSTSSSVIKLDIKLQDFQPSSLPETQDLNGLIRRLFDDPQTQELAYKYYGKARTRPEFRPHKSTLAHVIRYLIYSKNWSSVFLVSEDIKKSGILPDKSTCCRLISSCIRARKFRLVSTFLDLLKVDEEVAVLAFDLAMRSYNKLHMYSSTIGVYQCMKSSGIVLDSGCYLRIMEAYVKMGHNEEVVDLFQEFETRRLDMCISPFHTQIYQILCESLGKLGRPFEALEYFREMVRRGVITEDHTFFSSLVGSFASIRDVKMAEDLFKEAEGKKMLRDPAVFLKLVLMYVEEGYMESTLGVVAAMKNVNIKVSDCIFCAIVNGYAKRRGPGAAVRVYEELIAQGCEPGQVTYASVLNVYCRLGLYPKAEMVFWEMEKKGFDKCVVAYSSMVAMYGKTGRLKDATRLVAKMKERGCKPTVWIYNALLDMHGRALDLKQVEKTWKEMKRRRIVPDQVSYTSIISAYSKAREFDLCMQYYNEFRLNGGAIDRAMAGIMVSVFSKMSRIGELVKLLQDMKTEGTKLDGRLYRSALNALRDAGLQIQAKWLQESFSAV